MAEERKKCQIYHAIFSLLPEMRDVILREMTKHTKLQKYVPKYSSSDVRTCLPDTLYNYFQKQNNNKNSQITEEERNTYMRHFTPIVITPERSSPRKSRPIVPPQSPPIVPPQSPPIIPPQSPPIIPPQSPPSFVIVDRENLIIDTEEFVEPIPQVAPKNNIRTMFTDLYNKYGPQ